MWTTSKHFYSERSMLKMLKEASMEKKIEFLLEVTKEKKNGKV